MKRKVTEQALVRRAGLVTTATTLVLFPWRRCDLTMLLETQERTN